MEGNRLITQKYTIGVREPIRDKFNAWLKSEGFLYQGNPSCTQFINEITQSKWRRIKDAPKPDAKSLLAGRIRCMAVPPAGFELISGSLAKSGYSSWNHLIADFAEGNWRRAA